MNPEIRFSTRRIRQRGQTIIVAMIILGLLLILGFVFIGIINRNIQTTGRLQDRSVANDLSEAGIRYAHNQLLRSELGADWRGTPTPPIASGGAGNTTVDPDAFYLRPAAFTTGGERLRFLPGANTPYDLGGPDGLGPFIRVNFSNGRSLIRVRFAQTDANLFRANPLGPLRNPGLARNYIIIESVGREGRINVNDPTTLKSRTLRKFQAYNDPAEFQTELNAFREAESRNSSIHVNRAFASVGIIEHAYFATNKFRESRPIEFGVPSYLGAHHRADGVVAPNLRRRVGGAFPALTFASGSNASIPTGDLPGGGGTMINGDLKLYGTTEFNLNPTLGDMIGVAGQISTDEAAQMILNVARVDRATGNWNVALGTTVPPAQFSSRSPDFRTLFGLLRDGVPELDATNLPRSMGYKSPPSMLTKDPQTNLTRYQAMTRNAGVQAGTGSSGRFGYGPNPYIDNGSRRQTPVDASSRAVIGGQTSLVNEWLSPGSDPNTTGWRGYLYQPPGAYMELLSDGFTIQRDGTGSESTWRYPDGSITGQNFIRYRLGRGSDGRLRIVNTFSFGPANLNRINTNLGTTDYDAGPVFGGVVFFEGNVRVRGVVPTDIQMTVVSNASIYIEGSITKGVVGNHFTSTYPSNATVVGQRLTRPSRSMLMLMAKDYVALNTTQFFGAARGQNVIPKEDVSNVGSLNPIVMRAGDPNGLRMVVDFALDPQAPGATPTNPSTWQPFALSYAVPGNPASRLNSNLLLSHTMDNGSASASFVSLDVNPAFGNSAYLFPATDVTGAVPFTNLASEYIPGLNLPIYGLGSENFERYAQFESLAFPLVNPAQVTVDAGTGTFVSTSAFGTYRMTQTGLNDLHFRPQSVGGLAINDYLVGRLAVTPHDIKIEASIYAEEGSFFVIPGAWFNPNPNDTFVRWNRNDDVDGRVLTNDEKNFRRFTEFGSYPAMPFFGEPLDVRIQIVGAVSENMPVPMSVQAEWLRKWGWIPELQGSSGVSIPEAHARGTDLTTQNIVPNLTITYDPVLATGRQNGFVNSSDPNDTVSPTIRVDEYGRPLPPLPRLPVSPTLAFFGEER